jgi:hypothetical protein
MVKDNVQRDLKWLKIGSKNPIRTDEQHTVGRCFALVSYFMTERKPVPASKKLVEADWMFYLHPVLPFGRNSGQKAQKGP